MSTRTLSPSPAPPRPASGVLSVVADRPEPEWPGWIAQWVARTGWTPRHRPGTGPAAAAAAARTGDRVLVLRPAAPSPAPSPSQVPHVVAAVRRLPDDAPVVADAAAVATGLGARLTIVHAVPRSFAERSVGLAAALTRGRQLLDAAAARVAADGPAPRVDGLLVRVRPHELVGEALDADLLVVGGTHPDHPAAGPGLVAHSAVHHAPCPVLLVPR